MLVRVSLSLSLSLRLSCFVRDSIWIFMSLPLVLLFIPLSLPYSPAAPCLALSVYMSRLGEREEGRMNVRERRQESDFRVSAPDVSVCVRERGNERPTRVSNPSLIPSLTQSALLPLLPLKIQELISLCEIPMPRYAATHSRLSAEAMLRLQAPYPRLRVL